MSRILIVIPARIGSTRFPAKVLKPLGGLPVVEWCRRAALKAGVGPVVVATDHPEVVRVIEGFGGAAVLTPASCPSGTDRVFAAAEALRKSGRASFGAVLNVQGDEPFIRPSTIRAVARLIGRRLPSGGRVDIATAVVPMRRPREALDRNVVKAVVGRDGRCLYFSRSVVPCEAADALAPAALFRHIGIYGFTRAALAAFVRLKPSGLERTERLEQLRALEAGMTIAAAKVAQTSLAIDTPKDLARAQGALRTLQRRER